MKHTVFICGGHVTPAMALVEELTAQGMRVVFIGRKYAMEGSHKISEEYRLIEAARVPFLPLTAGRLQRSFTIYTIPSIMKIPIGLVQAIIYCLRVRPSVIVSFGGYIAFPVAIAGWLFGIPVVTHEQTMTMGLTNRIISGIARRVCVSFKEMVPSEDQSKVVYTGLPIRSALFGEGKKPPYDVEEPLLYVVGGSQGAQEVNRIVFESVTRLTRTFTIIHQVGRINMAEALARHARMPQDVQARYHIVPYVDIVGATWILRHAAIVAGRSGANTVMELAALGKVALLIPLPWAADNEQFLNARWLTDHGGAIYMTQDTLTPESFIQTIEMLWRRRTSYEKRAALLSERIPRDAAIKLAHEVIACMS